MAGNNDMALLRIYAGERTPGREHPLFQEVVVRAREAGLAGATVLRGPLGYGHCRAVQVDAQVDAGADLPTVIEIADQEARLRAFVADYPELNNAGLITIERIEVLSQPATGQPPALDSAP